MENAKFSAVFSLGKEDYPERKRTSIVIVDNGDSVHVGVKTLARVYENDEKGCLTVHEEQYGDYRTLSKAAPIGCIFDTLKELFDKVPEIIDRRTANGDEA